MGSVGAGDWSKLGAVALVVAALGCVGLGFGVPRARADAALTLTWSAPAECPQEPAVRAELRRLLGDDARAGAGVQVEARLAPRAGGRFGLTLLVRSEGGVASRTLEGVSCDALMQATALIVALGIDPEGVLARTAEPAPPDAVTTDAVTTDAVTTDAATTDAATTDAATQPPSAEPLRRAAPTSGEAAALLSAPERGARVGAESGLRLRGRALVHLLGEALAVPGVSAGLSFGGGLRVGRIDVTLEGLWASRRSVAVPTLPGASADFALLAARLRGCVALTGGLVEVAPCLGFELGSLRGESRGVSAPASGSTLWAAPLAGLEVRVALHALLALTARLDLAVPLRRPGFSVVGVGTVAEAGLVSVRGELGASLYFP